VLAVEASAMPSLAETLPAGASDEELKRAADIDRRIAELLPWRAAAPTANARLSAAESVEPVSVRLAGEGDRYAWIELQGSNERAVELRAIGTAAQVTLLSEDRRKVLDSFELQSGQKRSLRPLGGGSGLLRVHVDTPCSDDCAVELRAFARPRHTDFGADATVAPTLAPGRYVIEVKPEWTWAKFAAQEGKTYELRTAAADRSNAGAESEIDTELIVRTFPGDRRVAGNDDDDDAGMDTYYSKIRWKCPASGEYVVGVRRLEGGSRLDSLCEFSVAESAP
jgi:hypothetical protein